MHLFTNFLLSLRWTLRCAEWTLLLTLAIIYLLDGELQESPLLFLEYIAFNIAFSLLSFNFPIDSSLWSRQLYIASEMLLVICAVWFGLEFDILLYFF